MLKRLLRLGLAALALMVPSLGVAQNSFYTDKAYGQFPINNSTVVAATPIQYGQVRVCNFPATGSPCSNPASISDINGNPLSISGGNFGQINTDVTGRFSFAAPPGNYVVQIAASSSNTPQLNYPITVSSTTGGIIPFTTLSVTGASTLNGTLSVAGSSTFNGSAVFNALTTFNFAAVFGVSITAPNINGDFWLGTGIGQYGSMSACYAAISPGQTCHMPAGWTETFSADLSMNKSSTGFVLHGGAVVTLGTHSITSTNGTNNIFIKGTTINQKLALASDTVKFVYTGSGCALNLGGAWFTSGVEVENFMVDITGAAAGSQGLCFIAVDPGRIKNVFVDGITSGTSNQIGILMDGQQNTTGSTTQNVTVDTVDIGINGTGGTAILCRNGCNYNLFENIFPSLNITGSIGMDFECVGGLGAIGNQGIQLDMEILGTGVQFGSCAGVLGNKLDVGLSSNSNTIDVVYGANSVNNFVTFLGVDKTFGPRITDNSPSGSGNSWAYFGGRNGLIFQQQSTGVLTGNSADQVVYQYTIPPNLIGPGKGIRFTLWFDHTAGSATVVCKGTFGSTGIGTNSIIGETGPGHHYAQYTVMNAVGSQTAQVASQVNNINFNSNAAILSPLMGVFSPINVTENTANSLTFKFTFNVANTDTVTGQQFIVELVN